MRLPVRYTVGGVSGWGELVNISSGGALFTTERELPLGKPVELCVNWPVLLLEEVPLKLVIKGWIIRVEPGKAAVKIGRYEFRTSGSTFQRDAFSPERGCGTEAQASVSRSALQMQVANQAMQGVGV
ncbi:MAG TPA: PilZ domain-containing protein [Bryobacteraceae bacterium]|nr:PilZ domain-containing protein [Bryobacteraceae bacterium]